MKNTLTKSLREPKRNLEKLTEIIAAIDYSKIRLQQTQYIENLLATNKRLMKDFKLDNIIVF